MSEFSRTTASPEDMAKINDAVNGDPTLAQELLNIRGLNKHVMARSLTDGDQELPNDYLERFEALEARINKAAGTNVDLVTCVEEATNRSDVPDVDIDDIKVSSTPAGVAQSACPQR